jgi:hypothetical protein
MGNMASLRTTPAVILAVSISACVSVPPPPPPPAPPEAATATLTCKKLREGGLMVHVAKLSNSPDASDLRDNVVDAYPLGNVFSTSTGRSFPLAVEPAHWKETTTGDLTIDVRDYLELEAGGSLSSGIRAELKAKLVDRGQLVIVKWRKRTLSQDPGNWVTNVRNDGSPNAGTLLASPTVRVVTSVYDADSVELRAGSNDAIRGTIAVPVASGTVQVTDGCTTFISAKGANIARVETVYNFDPATGTYAAASRDVGLR